LLFCSLYETINGISIKAIAIIMQTAIRKTLVIIVKKKGGGGSKKLPLN